MNRWPVNKAYFWEIAPFFRPLLPLAAGILCYYIGWGVMIQGPYFAVLTATLFLILVAVSYIPKASNDVLTFSLATLLLFSGGHSIAYYNDIRNDKAWFGHSIHGSKSYLARIATTPAEKENSWKLTVTLLNRIDSAEAKTVTGKAFVYLQKDTMAMSLKRGDTLLVPGNWQALVDAGNPFEFSYATYCARNNIHFRQWCAVKDIKLYGPANPAAQPFTERAHDWCMATLAAYLSGHKAMGLLQAMLLGDEVNLDDDLRQSYTDTGIVHIIAISGGNVAIFFVVIAFLFRWLKHKKYLWVKYALALPIICFYVLMAGAQPSAMRAMVMFAILTFGVIMQKSNNGINQLMATAFLLLCYEPAWLFSVGFQLSFVAVLSILLFYKPIYTLLPLPAWKAPGKGFRKKAMQWIYNLPAGLWGVVAMSIAAEVLVAPLVIYHFHTFPVMFIVANVAAVLFMSFVLTLGMVLVVVSQLPLLPASIAAMIKWLVAAFGIVVAHLQHSGPDSFGFLMLTGYETMLLYGVLAGISWFLLRGNKNTLFTAMSATCLLLLSFCFNEWDRLHQRRLVVYNVAHANHIELIKGNRHSVLHTDPALSERTGYATRPAHIAWRAWQQSAIESKELFCIGGKTLLILNDELTGEGRFPVDDLILNYTGTVNVPQLMRLFSPSLIIAGNNYTPKELAELTSDCNKAGVAIHTIADKGAFVFPQ